MPSFLISNCSLFSEVLLVHSVLDVSKGSWLFYLPYSLLPSDFLASPCVNMGVLRILLQSEISAFLPTVGFHCHLSNTLSSFKDFPKFHILHSDFPNTCRQKGLLLLQSTKLVLVPYLIAIEYYSSSSA